MSTVPDVGPAAFPDTSAVTEAPEALPADPVVLAVPLVVPCSCTYLAKATAIMPDCLPAVATDHLSPAATSGSPTPEMVPLFCTCHASPRPPAWSNPNLRALAAIQPYCEGG